VHLETGEVILEMKSHIAIEQLQETLLKAGLQYAIEVVTSKESEEKPSCCSTTKTAEKSACCSSKSEEVHHHTSVKEGNGAFYCPMHCEAEKTYSLQVGCPVCGMDLVEQPKLAVALQYTCPMHPEVIKDEMGSCPICGMDLVPMEPAESEEDKSYQKLLSKMKISVLFTVPIFIIAMADLIPGNPLGKLFSQNTWNWIQLSLSLPVVFYATWMFFKRAYKSIVTWNLNMFTLIGIGASVAFLFSIVALLFPEVFPDQFKTESGSVFVYFEAVTVILNLVLLGQLLEAKAHSQTSGEIK
jgi:Cu2+-exporting ATPase